MLKRFMLFGYDNYYPGGGVDDLMATFSTIEEAKAFYRDTFSIGEILDTHTGNYYRRYKYDLGSNRRIKDWELVGQWREYDEPREHIESS